MEKSELWLVKTTSQEATNVKTPKTPAQLRRRGSIASHAGDIVSVMVSFLCCTAATCSVII